MQVSRVLAAVSGAAAALALAAPTAVASPQPGPTDRARGAGVAQRGEAWLGWSTRASAPRAVTARPRADVATVDGMDVSSHQGTVDWPSYRDQGKRFAYVKATEGDYYVSPDFTQQYDGSYAAGMIRGAYHFGTPNDSGGAAQADYFIAHGGGWSKDGQTLPGVLDIEYNPYGPTCYGLSQPAMVGWITAFTARYRERTGRDAVIYTTTDWWTTCTGGSGAFGTTNPLWIARYADAPGPLPAGWGGQTIWQYTSTPIDQNRFNGDLDRLTALANG